jgi:ribosomal protein L36
MSRKKTKEEFIEDARKVHGDKYDYSKVEYISTREKVTIICSEHGEFKQKASHHCSGHGCLSCSNKRFDTKTFIKVARKVHGDKYDYSKVECINTRTKVTIICPEHGEFKQTPKGHFRGRGCSICGGSQRFDTKTFIKAVREVHGDKYDYSKVKYVNYKTKVTIICPEHGEFKQTPKCHCSGSGCRFCADNCCGTEYFIKKSHETHGGKYNYSEVKYTNKRTKVTIICPKHGPFLQTPNNHRNGHGCPTCSESKGERVIRICLESYQIPYKPQYGFKTSTIKKQKFDFATKMGVIEYQGKPHYSPSSFGSKGKHAKFKVFEDCIQRDHKKLEWCQKHNIPLLIIPYWDKDRIPEILDDFFAGKTPIFSSPPKSIKKYHPVRKKIREHLKIEGDEVLCGLINS